LVCSAASRERNHDTQGLLSLRRTDGEAESEQKAAEALSDLHCDVS
jgi:hypothetical protein